MREKFEKQMDLIQTQREYEALDKEISDAGEREQELRRSLQREEQLLEEMRTSLDKEELMIKKQEEEVAAEQSRIQGQIADKQKELGRPAGRGARVTPGLDEELLFKFERIIRTKGGVGIVPIEQGVCTGCHMILSSQFVNDVRVGQSIRFCPNCSRILYYGEETAWAERSWRRTATWRRRSWRRRTRRRTRRARRKRSRGRAGRGQPRANGSEDGPRCD